MPTISLTPPTALTVITAGLHATNYAAIQTLLNGGLDNANINSAAGIAFSKMSFPGGSTFLKADGTWASTGPPLLTAPPGSPVDGQEYIHTDSGTAPTYAWYMRYSSGISDANKWLCIGGSSLSMDLYTNWSKAGLFGPESGGSSGVESPYCYAPRTGFYEVNFGGTMLPNGNNQNMRLHLYKSDVGVLGEYDIQHGGYGGTPGTMSRTARLTIASGVYVQVWVSVNFGDAGWTTTYADRWINIRPVRFA